MKNQAVITIESERGVCFSCSGTGCNRCGGRGEAYGPAELVSVKCSCGAVTDGDRWDEIGTDTCPACGYDMAEELDEAWAEALRDEEESDEPRDFDPFDRDYELRMEA